MEIPHMEIPLDIEKLATLNAVQRRVIYDTLDLDVLERHEAEEAVRRRPQGRDRASLPRPRRPSHEVGGDGGRITRAGGGRRVDDVQGVGCANSVGSLTGFSVRKPGFES